MKKDKKFLEELESYLGNSKHKDEIISKYASIIKTEKDNGKKIKYILKDLGSAEEIAKNELEFYNDSKLSIFLHNVKCKFKSLFDKKNKKIENKKKSSSKEKKDSNNKEKVSLLNNIKSKIASNKEKTKKDKNKTNVFASLKERFKRKDDKKKKEKKVKKEKTSFKEKLGKIKNFITKDIFTKKERKVTDSPKEVIEEVKEEFEDKISDVSEIVSETHIFESKKDRNKRIILKTLGVIITCLLIFIWLWITVIFFASLVAYLDGIKFKGIILLIFSVDLLVLWIVIMVNRAIFKKKMSVRLNLIITFILVGLIAIGIVLSVIEINKVDYVHDVSDKYPMTRKLETYDLSREEDEKFMITFNSNYNTQYEIKYDKNIKGKVKIETKYYECYYDYYVKTNTNGVYVSLKLDDRDRFSVYLDDIKEGKIYDNDELSRYSVKITINPDEANKITVQK